MEAKKPNILVIMTDQQRYDSLGCYGFKGIPTPNLDRLAEEGVLYENCYANNPICTPSRASFFTGRHLPGHGVYGLNDILPPEAVMFPHVLQQNGYETALAGKLHVSGATFERDRRNPRDGFDHYNWNHEPALFENSKYNGYARWLYCKDPAFYREFFTLRRKYSQVPAKYHCTTYLTECAADFILSRTSTAPFFCFLSIFDPHNPYNDCPREGLDRVNEAFLPPPRGPAGNGAAGGILRKPKDIQREHFHGYMGDVNACSPETLRTMQKGYYGSIAFIDMQLAKVFDALREKGEYDNTLIMFVSDHGDMLGDHELLAKGAFFYDPCTRVPLIVKYPREENLSGLRVKNLVQVHDGAAAILDSAGLWDEEAKKLFCDSRSLREAVSNPASQDRPAVCMYRGSGICDTMDAFDPPIHATMFRRGKHKLNLYHDLRAGTIEGELYDMETDPGETDNLWGKEAYRQCREDLKDAFINWMVQRDLVYNGGRGGHSQTVAGSLLQNKSTNPARSG
jgi:arylsulfatase A-like enzyme